MRSRVSYFYFRPSFGPFVHSEFLYVVLTRVQAAASGLSVENMRISTAHRDGD